MATRRTPVLQRTVIALNGPHEVLAIEHYDTFTAEQKTTIEETFRPFYDACCKNAVTLIAAGLYDNVDEALGGIRVQRFTLKDGDKVIVTVPRHTSIERIAAIGDRIRERLTGHDVLVLTDDVRLAVLEEA